MLQKIARTVLLVSYGLVKVLEVKGQRFLVEYIRLGCRERS